MSFVIGQEMRKQIDDRIKLVREVDNIYLFMSSVDDAYLYEDDEAIHITLKQPLFEGQPSIFDFRKPCLRELVTVAKRLFPLNCVMTDEFSMSITKYNCNKPATESYDRNRYLSNGRAPATTMYTEFNKRSARVGTAKKSITLELD